MRPEPNSFTNLTRRDFVSLLAAAGTAAPLAGLPTPAVAAARPAVGAAAGSPPTLHVFSKPLQWLPYEGAAELAAETGFGGVDFTVRKDGHVLPENVEKDLPRAVAAAQKAGLKVEMLVTGIADPRDKHTVPILKTAAKLGVKYYRFGTHAYDPKRPVWEQVQEIKTAVRGLADLNREYGLHGAFQNHPGIRFGSMMWDMHEVLRDLDPRWVGVQYDVRHATAEGGISWPIGLRLLHPWVRCMTIKDFHWVQAPGKGSQENVPLGQGIVNYDQYFGLLRELKISGPFTVHFEYPPFERSKVADAERRGVLSAAMKRDMAVLKRHLTKHQIA